MKISKEKFVIKSKTSFTYIREEDYRYLMETPYFGEATLFLKDQAMDIINYLKKTEDKDYELIPLTT